MTVFCAYFYHLLPNGVYVNRDGVLCHLCPFNLWVALNCVYLKTIEHYFWYTFLPLTTVWKVGGDNCLILLSHRWGYSGVLQDNRTTLCGTI